MFTIQKFIPQIYRDIGDTTMNKLEASFLHEAYIQ